MEILLVLNHVGVFRTFEGVVRSLCRRGHTVTILHESRTRPDIDFRALKACEAEVEGCRSDYVPSIKGRWRVLLWLLQSNVRGLINYASYFKPEHTSQALAIRYEPRMPRIARTIAKILSLRKLIINKKIQRTLRKVGNIFPPDPVIVRWLEKNRPDVVIASPFIVGRSREIEFIRSAKALKIPTMVAVKSWDNLTTKETFHVIPDLTVLWNQPLLEEAVELHDVPRDKILITGAPLFDKWFDIKPSRDRATFCRTVGIDSERPFVAYLASSTTIAGDETPFVRDFARVLRENPETRNFIIMVRPHPLNAGIWKSFSMDNVKVWPEGGDIPDVPESINNFYDTVFYSVATVGVNTSATLEAAIIDKPCVTILNERYRATQEEIGHFHHLLNGDFMEIARSFEESSRIIAEIHRGSDSKAENRRKFVRDFLRPCGIDKPASEVMADAIEAVAKGKGYVSKA